MSMTSELHRSLAAESFNRTWELLASEPSPERDRELLTNAFASRFHWQEVGSPRNLAISNWMVARVYAVLGVPALARDWAESALALVSEHDLGAFLEGSAHEALARAAAAAGDAGRRDRHLAEARRLLDLVNDEAEREVLAADIEDAGA